MDIKEKQKIRNAFDSILRADYLSIDRIKELNQLSDYYIDFFNTTSSILQKQDNFISGRRGTGKTTALLKGYYECLKTIHPEISDTSEYFINEKVLPLYIDLSSCSDMFNKESLELLELHFVRQLIDSLKRQIEAVFEEKFLIVFKKENPALDDLELIEKLLVKGITIATSKRVNVKESFKEKESNSIGASLSMSNPNVHSGISEEQENTTDIAFSETKGLNVQEFLNKINDIRKKAKIDYIYLFLDEYSDLNPSSQLHLSYLIKSLLGSKSNLFLKLGVITDRYDFGDKIIIGRDIYPIPLDLNEHVERLGGLSQTLIRFENLIPQLIDKRLKIFAPEIKIEDLCKTNKETIFQRLSRESMGVTRTIGIILQNAWQQAENSDCRIGLSELSYGIRSARKTYQKQFDGAIRRKLIPGFYNDLWTKIIEKAIFEKARHPDRPASHILIDPRRKTYFKIFTENFLIHLLEESRTSKYGGNYNLYSIDYDICLDLNIRYAEKKDEFTSARFIYDTVLSEFDGYFVSERLKSYKCPECGRIYEESEIGHVKVKRCHDDDNKLEEVIHKDFEISEGNLAEVEIKILGLIATLIKSDAMSAVDIANAVGCTRQKVSGWCTRVLAPKNEIVIDKREGRNYYFGEE